MSEDQVPPSSREPLGERRVVSDDWAIRVEEAHDEASLDHVRRLLEAGAIEFAWVVAEVFQVQGFAAELAGLPGRYAPPTGALLLATVDDAPAGCVALRDLGGGTCEMKRLYVTLTHRGLGVGKRLVEEVIHRAKRIGYHTMVLDTLPEMAEAIALYQNFGFHETAPYWSHPTPQAVFMQKPLGIVEASSDPFDRK